MLNIVSLLIGVVAALLAVPAFLPLLGWVNWLVVPVALIGLLFGLLSGRTSGRNLNLIVIAVGVVRLMLGGGLI
ncbi:MAG TPA: hypothetical protein VF759_17275 [Allosphingosinicella sp.]|jgi:hypothetical protein